MLLLLSKELYAEDKTDMPEMAPILEQLIAKSKANVKACNDGNAEICNSLGVRSCNYQHPDYFEAVKFFEQACKGGSALGCNNLGVMYDNGEGVRQNSKKALEQFGKACDMKEQQGCENYAKLKKQMDNRNQ